MACFTVIVFFNVTYSVVMMDPALSSGYFNSLLMVDLFVESKFFKIRVTKFAGRSSNISTVSSIYKSSNNSFNSVSENISTKYVCIFEFMHENTSAAFSLEIRRNAKAHSFASNSSKKAAVSISFISESVCCAVLYFLSCSN